MQEKSTPSLPSIITRRLNEYVHAHGGEGPGTIEEQEIFDAAAEESRHVKRQESRSQDFLKRLFTLHH